MSLRSKVITLLTDFGSKDNYVGTMKGVIARINPEANVVDVTHEISQGDIRGAAFNLWVSYKYFPAGTIHVVVVDPGVGTERRIICVRSDDQFFLVPDNGVFDYVCKEGTSGQIFEVTNADYFLREISHTFHGRDIFAPVAAHLSLGIEPEQLGRPVNDYEIRYQPGLETTTAEIRGEIIYIDHFGNLISNVPAEIIERHRSNITSIELNRTAVKLVATYAESPDAHAVALIGSSGLLEVAVNSGSAEEWLRCKVGERLHIKLGDASSES